MECIHSTKPSCEKEYIFTDSQDWLSVHLPVWVDKLLPHRHRVLASRGYIRILEIGSWEGRSAVWFLTQMCSGDSEQNCLVCVDHFDCGNSIAGQDRLKRMEYNINTTQLRSRARILKLFSVPALTQLSKEGEGFDVIYIDGSHRSDDTFLDAELAFRLANEGAIIVFDDYEWNVHSTASMEHPKRGIDAFLLLHSEEVTVLHKGYQILLMKATKPRLGFSWPLSEQAERLAALTDFDERKEKIETSLKLVGTTHVPWPDEIKHVSCAMQQPLSGTVGTDDALLDPSLLVEQQVMGQCVRDDGGLPTRGPLMVTGGAGFIGSHIVEQARATGCYSCVTVVDSFCRGSYSNLEGVVPVVEADLTSLADSISALQGADTVIHAAACVGGSQFVLGGGEYDVQATTQRIDQNVLEACIMSGVRCLVYITTACSYPEAVQASYDPADSALNEHHICRCGASPPESGYGLAKLCGENMGLALAKQGLLDFRMVRLHNVYGPRMALDGTAQVVPALIRRAIQTPQDEVLKVAGSGQQFRDFLYVADAAAAVLLAASEDHYPSVVPFGSGQAVRFFLLLTRLCSLFHQCSSPGYRSWRNKSHLFLNSHTVALNLIWRCQKAIRGGPVIHLRQLTWDGSQEYPCMKDSF